MNNIQFEDEVIVEEKNAVISDAESLAAAKDGIKSGDEFMVTQPVEDEETGQALPVGSATWIDSERGWELPPEIIIPAEPPAPRTQQIMSDSGSLNQETADLLIVPAEGVTLVEVLLPDTAEIADGKESFNVSAIPKDVAYKVKLTVTGADDLIEGLPSRTIIVNPSDFSSTLRLTSFKAKSLYLIS